MFVVFRVKNHDFTQKKSFFSNFRGEGGGAPGAPLLDSLLHTTIKVMNSFLIRVA